MKIKKKLSQIYRKYKNICKNFIYINFYSFIIYYRKIKSFLFLSDLIINKKLSFLNPENFKSNSYQNNNRKYKKIILVIGRLTHGGAERQVLRLAEYLAEKKFKVKIFAIKNKSKKDLTYSLSKNIKIDYLKIEKFTPLTTTDKNFLISLKKINFFTNWEREYCLALYGYLKKEKPDIIHSFLDFHCITSGYVAQYIKTKKVILSTRNLSPDRFLLNRPYFKEFYKSLLKFDNIVLVNNSNEGCASYEKWLGLKRDSIKLTNNIFDFNKEIKLRPLKLINKDINLVNIGAIIRLDPEKNPVYLIKLAEHLVRNNPNYYFYILGTGLLASKLKKYIKKNKLTNNIKLLGNKNNIYDYLNFFDYTLLTSKSEGLPNVLLESQMVGTPVITTDAGGAKEAIIKNYSGYFIGGESIKKDSKKIKDIVLKNSKSQKIDLRVIKKKLKKFSPLIAVQQVLDLYNL
jgi:glycosyltransferase involved in cell wall biosynthesis